MISEAVRNVGESPHRGRIRFVIGRAEQLPFPDRSFEAVTFTYLLRYVNDPAATIAELVRVVKPGGVIASLDFHVPGGTVWGPLWWVYTRAVLPAAGYLTGGREWYEVGRFLGPSISSHYERYPVDWLQAAWRDAGVEDLEIRLMSLGGGLVMSGRRGPE
jgi:demethylmenaquinone methyltransferase/2-methoxy-6-polyprenyl-1,4-benzoquinol methylase